MRALRLLPMALAQFPAITVPTITLEGDANGALYPAPDTYAKKFVGKYEHRNITGGIGIRFGVSGIEEAGVDLLKSN